MLLELKNIDAGYGFLQVLRNVSLQVQEGEYVSLIGPNGAGKSTLLKSVCGIVPLSSGDICFDGGVLSDIKAHKINSAGIAFISEEMNLFTNMTVRENLMIGAFTIKDKIKKKEQLSMVYEIFPRLLEREKQLSGLMSGGERKMLAIGRALMSFPKLLLVDEPSFGLSPQVTESVFDALNKLNGEGLTVLLVEQNVAKTLSVTDRAYVLENGEIVMEGKSNDLARDQHVKKVFLGR